jgi:DNA end-binding protein Ku
LAEQLIDSWTAEQFDYSKYVDTYSEKVRKLLAAKVAGREIVAPEPEEEPPVVNFMEALKRSLHHARRTRGREHRRARRKHAS